MGVKVHIDSLVEITSLLGTDLIQVQRTTLPGGNQDRKAKLINLAGLINSFNAVLADGTAAAPALKFANSLTTGLFSPGADSLGWSIAGTKRLSLVPLAGGSGPSQLTLDGQFVWGNGFGVLQSNGAATFGGGTVNITSDGVDVGEATQVKPDGSASFATGLFLVNADGSIKVTKVWLLNTDTGHYVPLTCVGPDDSPTLDYGGSL